MVTDECVTHYAVRSHWNTELTTLYKMVLEGRTLTWNELSIKQKLSKKREKGLFYRYIKVTCAEIENVHLRLWERRWSNDSDHRTTSSVDTLKERKPKESAWARCGPTTVISCIFNTRWYCIYYWRGRGVWCMIYSLLTVVLPLRRKLRIEE